MTDILVPVSAGELVDKLTILELKLDRITDPARQRNVAAEREALTEVAKAALPASEALSRHQDALADVNGKLWDVEDALRRKESRQDFGAEFVALARSVYRLNDKRAAIKREINELLGSRLVEEKSYADYRGEEAGP